MSKQNEKLMKMSENPYIRDVMYFDGGWYAIGDVSSSISEFMELMENRDKNDLDKEEDIDWCFNFLCGAMKRFSSCEEMYDNLLKVKDYCNQVSEEIDKGE